MPSVRIYQPFTPALLLLACTASSPGRLATTPETETSTASGTVPHTGVRSEGFDLRVSPREDFFQYVNGGWMSRTAIPTDKSDYGSFTALQDEAEANQREIILRCVEEAKASAAGGASNSNEARKVGGLYQSFMNTEEVERRGLAPLSAQLDAIRAIENADDLWRQLGSLDRIGVSGPVGFFVGQDAKDSEHYIGQFYQSGLGLPDRDYYLKDEPRFVEIRAKYLLHIGRILSLVGAQNSEAKASEILGLETSLAQIQWTRVERRDRNKAYSKRTLPELLNVAPEVRLSTYLSGAKVPKPKAVIARQLSYLKSLSRLSEQVPLSSWKTYLEWTLVRRFSDYLTQAVVNESFDFYGTTLRGTEVNRERWKRAVDTVAEALGQAVGKLYVREHFSPEAKERMERMVADLLSAFGDGLDALSWMSSETKAQARDKLSRFVAKIGYPNVWQDYSPLEIDPNDLVGNVLRSRAYEHDRQVARLPGPINREEWFITPQTVNAYYSSSKNEIVFPAAILQPPFFDLQADDAVNYGAIGAVIGHEISHGFDDQGRKSDGYGNLRDWWTAEDSKAFGERTERMVAQYAQFQPFESASVNGKLTLGENIGDLGGLTIAHRAYLLSLRGQPAPRLGEFTGPQRLFIGWGQIWRRKYREDELRRRLLTDPHAPSRYRVNGVLSNMPEFYEAFGVQSGDSMWRSEQERVKIW